MELNLEHLLNLTDSTGILQHSTHSIPNRFEGYCTDDNARLAIVGVQLEQDRTHAKLGIQLQHRGLSFLHHALNEENGRMRNFMTYNRTWLEEAGSEDSHGRAMWALGILTDGSSISGVRAIAEALFRKAMPAALKFTSPRAWAFAILGLDKVLSSTYCSKCVSVLAELANRLNSLFENAASRDWIWFEGKLAYDNARLPQALLNAGYLLNDQDMIANATAALQWLVDVQTGRNGCFLPIGSNGFYAQNGRRANYDQQPLEATATIEACYDAYTMTSEPEWIEEIHRAYAWFLGGNSEGRSLIDQDTGGCKDGLMESGVNDNQGAESTLAFLSSSLTYRLVQEESLIRNPRYLG